MINRIGAVLQALPFFRAPVLDYPPPLTDGQLHAFFHGANGVRRSLFPRGLSAAQVRGCERIMAAAWAAGQGQLERVAYFLATSFHETAMAMQPVKETQYGGQKMPSDGEVVKRLDRAFYAGRLTWVSRPYWQPDDEGKAWFGRGDVQLTHRRNYEALAPYVLARFGVDIVADPSKVLRPDVSAFIMIEGMTRGDTGVSDFTSSALETFINTARVDYSGARRTVNPGDQPSFELVAQYARAFEAALAGCDWPVARSAALRSAA